MMGLLNFSLLAVLTMFAVAAAAAFCWVSLRITILLIEPAAARRVAYSTERDRGPLSTNRWARLESRRRE